jgi:tetratricopeptide (TPR) repeat protein
MNIGILHSQQKDFPQALVYYLKTDSLIRMNHLSDIEFNIKLNLGDLYENMQQIDTALKYYFTALKLAEPIGDPYFLGATYLSLGSCYDILKKDSAAFSNYKKSMQFLRKANEENLYCSALKKTAKLFLRNNQTDSALLYAYDMLEIAGKDAFQVHLLDANKLLASIYKKNNHSDSVVLYMERANIIKDSMSSTEKIKAFQMKSINEQIRQNELAELRIKEEENRYQQLQLLLIGIFIPIFFLLTILLSRKKIHRKAIQVLGIVSLLLLFEYLTLLLHPIVLELTHHTPILELLVFVSIAAFLIPAHHRIEHWLIEKLTVKHKEGEAGQIKIHAKKIKIKNLSNLPETDN